MWLTTKYIRLLSSRLPLFKEISGNNFNFRCPFCGDSFKNKSKARGYLLLDDSKYHFYCHNCFQSLSFSEFIKSIDLSLYNEYYKEKLKEKYGIKKIIDYDFKTNVQKKFIERKIKIKKVSCVNEVKQYLIERKIPEKFFNELFYVEKFKEFVNSIIPNKIEETKYDEPRIIIPFWHDKSIYGFQGRAINDNQIRYITIMIDDSRPKIYNYYRCNKNIPHFILEGAFDSMFFENSMAMTGASIDYKYVNENSIFVFDNEPRSKDICKKISKTISLGYTISFFDNQFKGKDINDMILNGHSIESIIECLNKNKCCGLKARLKFNEWKKWRKL